MPAGGFDTGLNVWAENGELLVYVQRSGSLAEDYEYLKLGGCLPKDVRVTIAKNARVPGNLEFLLGGTLASPDRSGAIRPPGRHQRKDHLPPGRYDPMSSEFSMNDIARLPVTIATLVAAASLASAQPSQPLEDLVVTDKRFASVEVLTDHGKFEYHLDNTGERDVSAALQDVFNRTAALKDASATFNFLPGVYFIDAPITVNMVCLELRGNGHGGQDIHGMNLKSGTIFRFGKNTGPNCITFLQAGHSKSFPAGESPWDHKNSKVAVNGLTFVGHNNTDVDTAKGYSRFRGDEPNFRGLHWYPAKGRYQDVEKEGQRALVFKRSGGKNEMLRINSCIFTDLYVGIEADYCDVCHITDSWFAQMVYAIRIRSGAVNMIKNNCFADLETGVILSSTKASNLNGNGFAYVSKCFELNKIVDSTVSNNTLTNWDKSTGAAAFGAFCHVGSSKNLVMIGNSINQEIDSRAKTRTVDEKPNGRAFINIENSRNLMFANNVVTTVQTQTVVRLHNVSNSVITDNVITFAKGGNAVAQTGKSSGNFYRSPDPAKSAPFDAFKK